MAWQRTTAVITAQPPAPSMMRWLLSGVLMALAGVLLFILHASAYVKALSAVNIWWVSLTPVGLWLLLLCLRGWLWGVEVDRYNLSIREAERGQAEWETWARRHLIISASHLTLPDEVTAQAILDATVDALPSRGTLTRRLHAIDDPLMLTLAGLQSAIAQLPPALPVSVTLVTDLPDTGLTESFTTLWASLFPQRAVPAAIRVTPVYSMTWVEERLKQPILTVDLILVMQLCGAHAYSDALAALLMTSDDVAERYRLPHRARLLRPMPLELENFEQDFRLFLSTQTLACQTSRVLGDGCHWEKIAAPLMTIGYQQGAGWQPAERMLLEKWCGMPGPAAPWLLTALAADFVSKTNTSLMTLFSSGEERFITTVTSGSEDDHIG